MSGLALNDRLRRHLLCRLRHDARLKAVERAIETGLLANTDEDGASSGGKEKRGIRRPRDDSDDRFWTDFGDLSGDGSNARIGLGPLLAGRSRRDAARILRRHGIVLPPAAALQAPPHAATAVRGTPQRPNANVSLERATASAPPLSVSEVWTAVRDSAPPPRADEIAVMLLLCAAIDRAGIGEDEWRRVLRGRDWIVTVLSPVDGFELRLIRMLKGTAFGRACGVFDGYELRRDLDALPSRYRQGRSLIVFRGEEFDSHAAVECEEKVGFAVRLGHPVLGVADRAADLPLRLHRAASLRLETGSLTSAIVMTVLGEVLGAVPDDCAALLPDEVCAVLSLHDLAAAVRPGIPAAQVVGTLRRLAGVDEDGGGAGSGVGPAASGLVRVTSSQGERGRSGRKVSSGNEIIQPVPSAVLAGKPAAASGLGGNPAAVSVETLHGYGAAKDWALDLKQDLALWRAGKLPWSQMSTKLLLSGPPGTGKTTFARALCNTLQLPLAVTSVSTWLEPSYLGDVIRRMRVSFEEALLHSPAILFVDEIDGIGKRGQKNEHDDYWNSVVNRLLELLDGAVRSEGLVIVGATNHPDMIDPAIRRSGRLETHIEIPLPDVDALVGILVHHLGTDCPNVIATRPASSPQAKVIYGEVADAAV
jgi:hypothetical protein